MEPLVPFIRSRATAERSRVAICALALALSTLAGCAFDMAAGYTRQEVVPSESPAPAIELEQDLSVALKRGRISPSPRRGSRWSCVGSIESGLVYKPVRGELQVVQENSFQAFLVISAGEVVGAYLPVQRVCVPAVPRCPVVYHSIEVPR